MDETVALTTVRELAQAYRIAYGGHALRRLEERHATRDDVREALMTATACRAQDNGRWRVDGGTDLDGDDLTVVVVIRGGLLVVTVF